MSPEPRWNVTVEIAAPVAEVWEAMDDLTLIPRYHPEVRRVEMLSGQTRRAPGVAYKCIVPEGRMQGWCVERVVEHIPERKMSVEFPEDSWGLARMFEGFLAELTLESSEGGSTRVELRAYYVPKRWWVRLADGLLLRRIARRRARLTLEGLGRLVEGRQGVGAG